MRDLDYDDRERRGLPAPAQPRRAQVGEGGGGGERLGADALDSYLRSIRDIPILSYEQTYALAEAIEAEQAAFRRALFAIPGSALRILERWRERRQAGHVTAALSAHYRDGSGRDWSRRIDRAMRRLQPLVEQRQGLSRAASGRARARRGALDQQIAGLLLDSDIAFAVVFGLHKEFARLLAAPRSRRVAEERRRLGLSTPAARAQMVAAKSAQERLDQAKQTFVRHNLRLVITCAKRFRNLGVPFMDLIQEGNLGLMRAVEKFDHHRGFRFSTYAVWWIQQSIIRVIQNQSRTVRVPSHVYDLQLRHRRVEEELRSRHGREPTREEMAEALGIAPDALDPLRVTMKPIASTHAPVMGSEGLSLEDSLEDAGAPDPVQDVDRREVRRELHRLLEHLSPREREILECRFGLRDESTSTLEEIGRRLGLSRERVRQIESQALGQLRRLDHSERLAASIDLVLDDAP